VSTEPSLRLGGARQRIERTMRVLVDAPHRSTTSAAARSTAAASATSTGKTMASPPSARKQLRRQ
jgi:hypothetical protein